MAPSWTTARAHDGTAVRQAATASCDSQGERGGGGGCLDLPLLPLSSLTRPHRCSLLCYDDVRDRILPESVKGGGVVAGHRILRPKSGRGTRGGDCTSSSFSTTLPHCPLPCSGKSMMSGTGTLSSGQHPSSEQGWCPGGRPKSKGVSFFPSMKLLKTHDPGGGGGPEDRKKMVAGLR